MLVTKTLIYSSRAELAVAFFTLVTKTLISSSQSKLAVALFTLVKKTLISSSRAGGVVALFTLEPDQSNEGCHSLNADNSAKVCEKFHSKGIKIDCKITHLLASTIFEYL